jgi:hypothetical protein
MLLSRLGLRRKPFDRCDSCRDKQRSRDVAQLQDPACVFGRAGRREMDARRARDIVDKQGRSYKLDSSSGG